MGMIHGQCIGSAAIDEDSFLALNFFDPKKIVVPQLLYDLRLEVLCAGQ